MSNNLHNLKRTSGVVDAFLDIIVIYSVIPTKHPRHGWSDKPLSLILSTFSNDLALSNTISIQPHSLTTLKRAKREDV